MISICSFLQLHLDNPKINAFYVIRGRVEGWIFIIVSVISSLSVDSVCDVVHFCAFSADVPHLPPLPSMEQHGGGGETVEDEDDEEATNQRERRRRGGGEPKITDPYATDDPSSMLLPIVIAVGAFIPLVFCLCKL